MLGRVVLDLALRPVAVAVAAPSAAWALAGGLVRVAVRGPEELRRTLDLLERAQDLLSVVDPPVRRVAAQVDDRLVDDLVLSARAAPALVATASQAVGEFQVFVDYAQGARAAADRLLADLSAVLRRTEDAVSGTERVLARIDPVVETAEGTVGRAGAVVTQVGATAGAADALVARASGTVDAADALVPRVSGTVVAADAVVGGADGLVRRVALLVELAEALAGAAQHLVDDAVELAGRARPAVEQAADLGEQLVDPAAALVPVVREQAPAVAAMLPELVHVLGDVLQDLPELLQRIDRDVLPTLRLLRSTPGDVRALRDTVADIEPLVGDVEAELAGLPGSGLLRRRGRKADVEEQASTATGPAPGPPQ